MAKHTKEGLLAVLIELAEKLGKKPTKFDLIEHGLPNANTFRYHGISLGGDWLKDYAYSKNPSYCECCGQIIPREKARQKHCSRQCAAMHNNEKRHGSAVVRQIKECLFCSSEFKQIGKQKYCSHKCRIEFQFVERLRDWYQNGVNFGNRTIRDFLTVWKGYQCSSCGISEWNGKEIVLEVEHIDGNSEDSNPNNVCLLCPNCHSQTDTYKGKNVGNGRHARRVRYKEGKSY